MLGAVMSAEKRRQLRNEFGSACGLAVTGIYPANKNYSFFRGKLNHQGLRKRRNWGEM